MSDPAKRRPTGPPPALWRQAFDLAEKAVSPRAESLVRTPSFAQGAALARRAQKLARDSARGLTALGRTAARTTVPTIIDFLRRRSDPAEVGGTVAARQGA